MGCATTNKLRVPLQVVTSIATRLKANWGVIRVAARETTGIARVRLQSRHGIPTRRLAAMGQRARAMLEAHFTRRQALNHWSDVLDRVEHA